MPPAEAKRLMLGCLLEHNLPFEKVTAKTTNFIGASGDRKVFVTIHGWNPNPAAQDLKQLAHSNGFCVEFKTPRP